MADASAEFRRPELLPPAADLVVAQQHDGLRFWQFMVAGSVAGLVEHTAMFPVDTLKTRMQAGSSACHRPLGLSQAVRSVVRAEGALGLYRGLGAMSLGAGPAHAVYFSVYEISKKSLSRDNPNNPVAHAASGVLATVASDAVFTPMDTVKQRLQLKSSPYKGVADCISRVLREEGIRAFFASYRTTVVMNAPYTAVHFATYEAAKRGLMEVSPEDASDERLVVHATAGAAAGALAAAVTTPLDVVKTQLQCQGVCGCDRFSSSSTSEVIRAILRRDGYAGLMRGWKPRMLFHAPAAAICWSTYEAMKSFFEQPNDQK
ncbi:Mitochondrial carrier protein [Musa troglodytarum]|uniref:Mitochondrial carrier protein n=1 Tax=Musa troglodytarum TaxID=320322 RepID=A0A9E7I529_9LILI|nr:Mitochondrial carrier protein [Musa troglodytarum]